MFQVKIDDNANLILIWPHRHFHQNVKVPFCQKCRRWSPKNALCYGKPSLTYVQNKFVPQSSLCALSFGYALFSIGYVFFSFHYVIILFSYALFSFSYVLFTFKLCALFIWLCVLFIPLCDYFIRLCALFVWLCALFIPLYDLSIIHSFYKLFL